METETKINKFSAEYLQKAFSDGKDVYTFILTTNEVDRDFEIVETRGIDTFNFMKNPQAFSNHKSWEKPIGQWTRIWIQTENGIDKMHGEMFFHELDEESKEMKLYADAGLLRCVSIGFRTLSCFDRACPLELIEKYNLPQNKTVRVIDKSELLECSPVWLPANGAALRVKALQLKEANQITEKQFNQLLEAIPMPEIEETKDIMPDGEKVGAALSSSNKSKIQSAYEAMNTAIKALSDLLGEPDDDEMPMKTAEPIDVKSIIDAVRKEFDREFQMINEKLEQIHSTKGGCDCDHDTKDIESKPMTKKELLNIIESSK